MEDSAPALPMRYFCGRDSAPGVREEYGLVDLAFLWMNGIIYGARGILMEGKGLSKREKLIGAWRRNPGHVDFDQLKAVLQYYGCYVRQPSGGSSHYVFGHQALYEITVVRDQPLKAIYVKRALALIDDIREAIADGDD